MLAVWLALCPFVSVYYSCIKDRCTISALTHGSERYRSQLNWLSLMTMATQTLSRFYVCDHDK